ncbi:MAG: tetratricopeptide repeat protein [Pyrinomonadaceae bacterium]|nr:tetratricopeptide repeat protein [Pyrinomonadaceae bacterium]MBP6211739.1 tetratricopeptide repeat protein [Pyrinomonadaceae bacterium]
MTFRKTLLPVLLIGVMTAGVVAQDDEARQTSGLPTFIGPRPGANPGQDATLSGSVVVQGLDESADAPKLSVAVFANGAFISRQPIKNRGSFIFNGIPRNGVSIIVELDKQEIGRYQIGVLNPPPLTNRQDVILTAAQFNQVINRRNEVIAVINAYQRTPENQKAFEKALSLNKEKKADAAQKSLRQLLTADANDFVAWTELGNIQFNGEKYADAESSYGKAIALKADFGPALLNLGKLYISQKKFDNAIEVLEKAVAISPVSADVNHYLGESYLQAKKGNKAVVYLNKAIQLAPLDKAEIHLRLAALYNAANLKDRASNEYKQYLAKVPDHPDRAKFEKYIVDNPIK